MEWQEELALANKAARDAAAMLKRGMAGPQTVLDDAGSDIKLQADRDAEALILDRLAPSGYSVLAEEGGLHGEFKKEHVYWVVDPLDGTFNYSRKIPICCVSIGLMRGDDPVLGVIHDFNRDEVFEAVVGNGAFMNGDAIRVASPRPQKQAAFSTGFSAYRQYDQPALLEQVRTFLDYKKVRLIGSAALAMAYVACGRFDLYVDENAMVWDIAAGAALVVAAGGHVELAPSTTHRWGRVTRAAAQAELFGRPTG
jgi:myo-inositol-1(or 4)-monophosphatase